MRVSPSAFQIRYGGCKGVVSLWPELKDDQLHVRESMEKFKSDHHELEVVQYTKPGDFLRLLFSQTTSFSLCYIDCSALGCSCPVVVVIVVVVVVVVVVVAAAAAVLLSFIQELHFCCQ